MPLINTALDKALAAYSGGSRCWTLASERRSTFSPSQGIGKTYVSQILRLTLLAPEIVEAIVEGRQPAELQLVDLLAGFPLEWDPQRQMLRVRHSARP